MHKFWFVPPRPDLTAVSAQMSSDRVKHVRRLRILQNSTILTFLIVNMLLPFLIRNLIGNLILIYELANGKCFLEATRTIIITFLWYLKSFLRFNWNFLK